MERFERGIEFEFGIWASGASAFGIVIGSAADIHRLNLIKH